MSRELRSKWTKAKNKPKIPAIRITQLTNLNQEAKKFLSATEMEMLISIKNLTTKNNNENLTIKNNKSIKMKERILPTNKRRKMMLSC